MADETHLRRYSALAARPAPPARRWGLIRYEASRLSVFAGGSTLDAAEAVGTGEGMEEGRASNPPLLDLLASLMDKSLVIVSERSGGTRYRLLETVRQYGREKLEASGDAEAVGRRHAGCYLALAEGLEPDLREQGAWLQGRTVSREFEEHVAGFLR